MLVKRLLRESNAFSSLRNTKFDCASKERLRAMDANRRGFVSAALTKARISASATITLLAVFRVATVIADPVDEARCVFPFVFEGARRDSCVSLGHSQPWCSTTRNYDADRMWRNCRAEDMGSLPRLLPQVTRTVSARAGDDVRLTCVVQNLQNHAVVWSKRGEEHPLTIRNFVYTKDGRLSVENETSSMADGVSVWRLLIREANQSDSGVYECRITLRSILLVYDLQLVVAARAEDSIPAVTLGDARSRTVDKGEPFVLQCNATSRDEPDSRRRASPPEVEWFKDGTKINSVATSSVLITNHISGRVRISTLKVDRSTMEDAGTYICRTTEQTFAEVKVHVLNVDKENKKRGTAHEARDRAAQSQQAKSGVPSPCRPHPLSVAFGLLFLLLFVQNS